MFLSRNFQHQVIQRPTFEEDDNKIDFIRLMASSDQRVRELANAVFDEPYSTLISSNSSSGGEPASATYGSLAQPTTFDNKERLLMTATTTTMTMTSVIHPLLPQSGADRVSEIDNRIHPQLLGISDQLTMPLSIIHNANAAASAAAVASIPAQQHHQQRGDRPTKKTSATKKKRPRIAMIPAGHGGPVDRPNHNDVLSGRGGAVNRHPGNVRYRNLVDAIKAEYLSPTTRKLEKGYIATSIVNTVRQFDPPGRFLKEEPVGSGIWYEIGDKVAIRKTGQALRENSSENRIIWMDAIADVDAGAELTVGGPQLDALDDDWIPKKEGLQPRNKSG